MKISQGKNIAYIAGIIIVLSFVYSINVQPVVFGNPFDFLFDNPLDYKTNYEINNFNSYEELFEFLKDQRYNSSSGYYESPYVFDLKWSSPMAESSDVSVGLEDIDYSETNIQVEGVDEPDIVKTDGTFIYLVANSKLYIINAYPAEDAALVSNITLKNSNYISNMFVNNNKLVIFGNSYRNPSIDGEEIKNNYDIPTITTTTISVYDIQNRETPNLVKNIELDGNFQDARMIKNYVFVIATENTGQIYRVLNGNDTFFIPEIKIDNEIKKIPADTLFYVNSSERIDTMTHVLCLDLKDNSYKKESYLISSSHDMYVSKTNIYLTSTEYTYISANLFEGRIYPKSYEKTVIHKISIKDGDISYIDTGEVTGRILNQFSMDENKGFFRIATTTGQVWNSNEKSKNNIYILDENLDRVSEIENIAPGEKIYSARFMGDKVYLVTFKKIDPFFTIDLSDPKNPKIIGKLKIPGYSDYLHPLDENHIIGIGKDTVEPQEGYEWTKDFAWYQGIKIAVFDVTDFENPKEVSKIIIGDRGTTSPALHNHKAFLFDKEKELLVIPVSLCEIPDEIKEQNNGYTGSTLGDFTFQGAYVYKLNLEGFEYRGRITHLDDEDLIKSSYYYSYYGSKNVERSLFIGSVLYTISDSMIKMNDLDDLSEINSVKLT